MKVKEKRGNIKDLPKACGLCCTKVENFSVFQDRNEILKDINLHIHCGALTAVIGPNGAGKTTFLKAILGEVKHSGNLKFEDHKGLHSNRPVIGYVPQNLHFEASSPVSVLDFYRAAKYKTSVWLPPSAKTKEEVQDSLMRVKAEHLIGKKMGNLSGGELQRVLLALALDPVPDLLLLDEPLSGIDEAGIVLFYDLVSEIRKNFDLSIILVSHDLNLVHQYADKVIFMNKTVIASGSPEDVFNNPQFISAFGKPWIKRAQPVNNAEMPEEK